MLLLEYSETVPKTAIVDKISNFYRATLCYRGVGSERVCLCVCHKPVLYRNGIELVSFCTNFPRLVILCVLNKLGCLQNKGTSVWNLVKNSRIISPRHVHHRRVVDHRPTTVAGYYTVRPTLCNTRWAWCCVCGSRDVLNKLSTKF